MRAAWWYFQSVYLNQKVAGLKLQGEKKNGKKGEAYYGMGGYKVTKQVKTGALSVI